MGGMNLELPNMMNPDGTMDNPDHSFYRHCGFHGGWFHTHHDFYRAGISNQCLEKERCLAGGTGKEERPAEASVSKSITVASPMKGRTMKLSEVPDERFASGLGNT